MTDPIGSPLPRYRLAWDRSEQQIDMEGFPGNAGGQYFCLASDVTRLEAENEELRQQVEWMREVGVEYFKATEAQLQEKQALIEACQMPSLIAVAERESLSDAGDQGARTEPPAMSPRDRAQRALVGLTLDNLEDRVANAITDAEDAVCLPLEASLTILQAEREQEKANFDAVVKQFAHERIHFEAQVHALRAHNEELQAKVFEFIAVDQKCSYEPTAASVKARVLLDELRALLTAQTTERT